MSDSFASRVKRLQRDINDLRYGGALATSYIGMATQDVDISMQMVGYKVNYANDHVAGKNSAIIKITPTNGMVACAYCTVEPSDEAKISGRWVQLSPIVIGDDIGYKFNITDGSTSDYSVIQGGGSVPAFTIHLTVFCTSPFTTTLTYHQEH